MERGNARLAADFWPACRYRRKGKDKQLAGIITRGNYCGGRGTIKISKLMRLRDYFEFKEEAGCFENVVRFGGCCDGGNHFPRSHGSWVIKVIRVCSFSFVPTKYLIHSRNVGG